MVACEDGPVSTVWLLELLTEPLRVPAQKVTNCKNPEPMLCCLSPFKKRNDQLLGALPLSLAFPPPGFACSSGHEGHNHWGAEGAPHRRSVSKAPEVHGINNCSQRPRNESGHLSSAPQWSSTPRVRAASKHDQIKSWTEGNHRIQAFHVSPNSPPIRCLGSLPKITGNPRPLVAPSKATKEQQLLSACFLLRHSKAYKQKKHRVWAKPGKGELCSAFPAVLVGNFVEPETWEGAQRVPQGIHHM